MLQEHDDSEDHRRRSNYRRADQHRFRGGLESISRAIGFLQLKLRVLEIRAETEFLVNILRNVRLRFDLAQFIDGLGVVRYRAEAVHRNRHRSHSKETERDKT